MASAVALSGLVVAAPAQAATVGGVAASVATEVAPVETKTTATISGTITGEGLNDSLSTPIVRARVDIQSYINGSSVTVSVFTDSSGAYVAEVEPGAWSVNVHQYAGNPDNTTGYLGMTYKSNGGDGFLTVAAGETHADINMKLKQGAVIRGVITQMAANGVVSPLVGVDVAPLALGGGALSYAMARTGSDGSYLTTVEVESNATLLDGGKYKVGFGFYSSFGSFIPEYFDDTLNVASATIITPAIGTTTTINAELATREVTTPPVEDTVPTPTDTVPTSSPTKAAATSNIAVDGTILITGSGFNPFEEVEIWLHSDPILLGVLTADKNGVLSGNLALPAGVPAGNHHIVVGAGLVGFGSTAVTVAADGTVSLTPVVTTALAETGAPFSPTLFGGLAALFAIAGAALLAVRNRRAVRARTLMVF